MRTSINVSASRRTKHVFPSNEIPHLWAHKVQSEARNSTHNLYFENGTIYSYGSHFPIAKHYSGKSGVCILFTTARYSVTTSAHCSHVSQAIPPSTPVFHVPNVLADAEDHRANLADYVSRIQAAIIKSARARSSWTKQYEHDSAIAMSADARAYAKFFRVRCPALPDVPAIDSEAMADVRKREAKQAAERAEKTRKENEQYAIRQSRNAELWRKGEYHGGFDYGFPVMLRIASHAANDVHVAYSEVETSKGARVPVSHAKRALAFVRKVKESGIDWQTNGRTFHIGCYSVDRVKADGTLYAGCHVIAFDEIERIAPALESLTDAN